MVVMVMWRKVMVMWMVVMVINSWYVLLIHCCSHAACAVLSHSVQFSIIPPHYSTYRYCPVQCDMLSF